MCPFISQYGNPFDHVREWNGYEKLDNVGCGACFKGSGKIHPYLVKYQDREQFIHTIKDFTCVEEKIYSNSYVIFSCAITDGIRKRIFYLIYLKFESIWKIQWKD